MTIRVGKALQLWNEQNFIIKVETDRTQSTCICVILKKSAHYQQMTYNYYGVSFFPMKAKSLPIAVFQVHLIISKQPHKFD